MKLMCEYNPVARSRGKHVRDERESSRAKPWDVMRRVHSIESANGRLSLCSKDNHLHTNCSVHFVLLKGALCTSVDTRRAPNAEHCNNAVRPSRLDCENEDLVVMDRSCRSG